MNTPWFRPWYAFLAKIPDLIFLNNSLAGRDDYAHWMHVSPARFEVIRNGITQNSADPTPEQIAAFRHEIALAPHHRLLTGIFRFSEEKRPQLFLETACAPPWHACCLTSTPPSSATAPWNRISAPASPNPPFAPRIHLLPPRTDMPIIYAATDVLLQTSILEGTPNTLLEAQAAGCPVVTTPAGGAVECLVENQTGFIAEDAPALADRALRLLNNPALRSQFSAAARLFIHNNFAMQRMINAHTKLYTRPQSPHPQTPALVPMPVKPIA